MATIKIWCTDLYESLPDNNGETWRYLDKDRKVAVFKHSNYCHLDITLHDVDPVTYNNLGWDVENPGEGYETKDYRFGGIEEVHVEVFKP